MNDQGDVNHATGREIRCTACRKPLQRPSLGQRIVICSYCKSEEFFPAPIGASADSSWRIDTITMAPELPPTLSTAAQNVRCMASDEMNAGADDDFEFKLEPEPNRPSSDEASAILKIAADGLHSMQTTSTGSRDPSDEFILGPLSSSPQIFQKNSIEYEGSRDPDSRTERARAFYNETSGLYPLERHYPTLESMRRLYYLFGYVSILITFPYLAFRFIYVFVITDDQLLQDLGEFSEFAVPLMFGCIALAATLFAASEGIKLAMDIQDNTLRIANRSGRRKAD